MYTTMAPSLSFENKIREKRGVASEDIETLAQSPGKKPKERTTGQWR